MNRTVIVHGPMGCGKTRNAEKLRRHFNCKRIQDSWDGSEAIRPGSLVLTYLSPSQIAQVVNGPLVVEFGFVMRQLGEGEAA